MRKSAISIRKFLLAAACACAALAPLPAAAGAPALEAKLFGQAHGFEAYKLPNGFEIYLLPYPSASDVRVELGVRTGSKMEGYGETGMAHLLEHMLFKSAGQFKDIKAELTALGADWNGTTTADRTNFFETVPSKHLSKAISIEAARLGDPKFTKADLDKEMSVVRNELERNDNSPENLLIRALLRQSFFWHGYGRPTIGSQSDIESAPFYALQAFNRKHYRPDNAYLIISGSFDKAKALAQASSEFGKLKNPAEPKPASWTRELPGNLLNFSEIRVSSGKTLVASAWRIPAEYTRETLALELALSAVCDPDYGTMRKELVLDKKIAVSASCSAYTMNEAGIAIATAQAGPSSPPAKELLDAAAKHLEAAAAGGISASSFEKAKKEELLAYEKQISDHKNAAGIVSGAVSQGDWLNAFRRKAMVESVTLAQAQSALQTFITPDARASVIVTDGKVSQPDINKASKLLAPESAFSEKWARESDPLPLSFADLSSRSSYGQTPEGDKYALLSRKNSGGKIWISLAVDAGNEKAMQNQAKNCAMAQAIAPFGGNGMTRDEIGSKLTDLKTTYSLGLSGFGLETDKEHAKAAWDLLLGAFASPSMPKAEFDRAKEQALAALDAAQKDPAANAANAAAKRLTRYPKGHPLYSNDFAEERQAIQNATWEGAAACKGLAGRPGLLRLSASGEIAQDQAAAMLAQARNALGVSAAGAYERIAELPAPSEFDDSPIIVAMPDKPNASIAGIVPLRLKDTDPDYPALRIAVKALGGDAQSRIWKRLREQEGLAYGAGAGLAASSFDPSALLTLYASAASPNAEKAKAALESEWRRFVEQGLTDQEVQTAKSNFAEERKAFFSNEAKFGSAMLSGLYLDRKFEWFQAYDDKIKALTPAQVNEALRKAFAHAKILWAVGKGQ